MDKLKNRTKKEKHWGNKENKKVSPLKAIRLKCKLDCCNNDRSSWIECDITACWLHPFRFGKNPFSKRKGNADKLKAYRDKLNGGLGNGASEQDTKNVH